MFLTNPFFIYFPTFQVLIHPLSRNSFTLIKFIFFTAISKNAVAYITLIETNISNNIIKQCYDIMKTLKVLITVS